MRPLRVVFAHPVIQRGLRLQQRRERPRVVEQLAPQRLMEALDGYPEAGEAMLDWLRVFQRAAASADGHGVVVIPVLD